jgi:hypothetical protein
VLLPDFFYHPFTKLGGHLLNIATVQVQLLGDLFIRQIQAHKVQAENPDLERLMVSGKDGVGQIIEASLAIFALMALPIRLFLMVTPPDNIFRITKWALYPIGPAQLTHCGVTLGVIYQVLYIYLHLLDSFWEVAKANSPFTMSCPWNPT